MIRQYSGSSNNNSDGNSNHHHHHQQQHPLYTLSKLKVEAIKAYQGQSGHYAKIFLLNDKLNQNNWRATWEAIKLDANTFIGMPTILTPDLDHVYSVTYEQALKKQEIFRNGTILDIVFNEGNHTADVITKVNHETWEKINSHQIEYVSPALWPRTTHDIDIVDHGNGIHEHVVHRFLGLHLAFVDDPAYNKLTAFVNNTCDGTSAECMEKLRHAQFSSSIYDNEQSHITVIPIMVKTSKGNLEYVNVTSCVKSRIQTLLDGSDNTTPNKNEITEDMVLQAKKECGIYGDDTGYSLFREKTAAAAAIAAQDDGTEINKMDNNNKELILNEKGVATADTSTSCGCCNKKNERKDNTTTSSTATTTTTAAAVKLALMKAELDLFQISM